MILSKRLPFFSLISFRAKVLERSLWLVMLASTACRTSWSTSRLTTDSVLTFFVWVSAFLVFVFLWLFYGRKHIFSCTSTRLRSMLCWQPFGSPTISVLLAVGSVTGQVIVSVSRPYFVAASYGCVKLCYYSRSLRGVTM